MTARKHTTRARLLPALVAVLTACTAASSSAPPCAPAPEAPGADEWSIRLPAAPGAVAADAAGAVVTLERGEVLAFDTEGAAVWQAFVAGVGLDWPAIDDDLVVVPASTAAGAACVGLDRHTGALRWRAEAGPGAVAATALRGDTAFCAGASGTLVAVDRSTGVARWTVTFGERVGGRPVALSPRTAIAIDDATGLLAVVLAVEGRWWLGCLRVLDGADACGFDLSNGDLGADAAPSAPAVAGPGRIVVGDGSRREVLFLDVASLRARVGVPTAETFDPASIPLVAAGLVVVVDRGGGITAVDPAQERLRWRARLDQPVLDARPVVAGEAVLVTDWARSLHAFGLRDGRPRAGAAGEGVVGIASDASAAFVAAARRGATGNVLEGRKASEEAGSRPLQCAVEPGQSIRNEARP